MRMRVALAQIIYHCDIHSMYESHADFVKTNEKLKRKANEAQAKLLDQASRQRGLTHEGVLMNAMQQHMLLQNDEHTGSCFFSAPKACLALQSVESALNEPLTKARCVRDADEGVVEIQRPDLDTDGDGSDVVTFQIVMNNPADKKVIRPTVGAGGRLTKGAVVISHTSLCGENALSSDTVLIGENPSATQDVSGQFLLRGFAGNLDELQTTMRTWDSASLAWTLRDSHLYGFQHGELHNLLHGMVTAAAFESSEDSPGFSAVQTQMPVLQMLAQHGLVTSTGREDIRWHLTDKATKQLTTCSKLENPSRVFRVREHLPLQERSAYELMMAMQEAGWEWRRWVPPSKRTRRMAIAGDTFDDYSRGGRKLWYSNESPSRCYMLALLNAETFFDMGLPAIAHGREEACYKNILRGDLEDELARFRALPAEIDEALPDDAAGQAPPPRLEDADEPGAAADSDDSLEAMLEEMMDQDGQIAEDDGSVHDDGADQLDVREAVEEPAAAPDGAAPAAAPAAANPVAAVAPAAAGPRLEGGLFGMFRISTKAAGTVAGGQYGGYQATCLYHAKNAKTGCKRYLSVPGPSQEDRDITYRRLCWWLCMSADYNRQCHHLVVPLPADRCPNMAVLEAQVALERPDSVKTDVELDAEANAAVSAAAKGKAKAKAKSKRAPKGKAKPKPKAAAAAAAPARDDDEDEAGDDDDMPPDSSQGDSDSSQNSASSSSSSSSSDSDSGSDDS